MGELIYFPKVNYKPKSPQQGSTFCEIIPIPKKDIKSHRYLMQYNSVFLKRHSLLQQKSSLLNQYYRLGDAERKLYSISAANQHGHGFGGTLDELGEFRTEIIEKLTEIDSEISELDASVTQLQQQSPIHGRIKMNR